MRTDGADDRASVACRTSAETWSPTAVSSIAYPFMVNALEAGTIVAVMAGAIGWFMVLRRQTLRRPHARRWWPSPARPAARAARRPRRARLLRLLRRRRARDRRGARRERRAALQRRVRRDGHGAGVRARARLPVPQPLRRLPRRDSRRCCSAPSSGSPRAGAHARSSSRSSRSRCSPSSGGRCSSPRSTATVGARARRPGPRALGVAFLLAARAGGRGDQPDHRRAARVRPAGGARRRPPSCSPPAPLREPRC